jgi:hypothetical protein
MGIEAKGHDLDWQRSSTQPADLLGLVYDHHKPPGMNLDDLFPQQRAAQALDHVQLGIDLISAIHNKV